MYKIQGKPGERFLILIRFDESTEVSITVKHNPIRNNNTLLIVLRQCVFHTLLRFRLVVSDSRARFAVEESRGLWMKMKIPHSTTLSH